MTLNDWSISMKCILCSKKLLNATQCAECEAFLALLQADVNKKRAEKRFLYLANQSK